MFPPTKGLCIRVDHNFDQFQRCNARNYRGKNALKSVKIGLKRAFPKQNKVILLFGSKMLQVRVLSLRYKKRPFLRLKTLENGRFSVFFMFYFVNE